MILRWHLQLGDIVIPKSVTPRRIRENIDIFDFELSHREMAVSAISTAASRIGPEPDTFGGSRLLQRRRIYFRYFEMLK